MDRGEPDGWSYTIYPDAPCLKAEWLMSETTQAFRLDMQISGGNELPCQVGGCSLRLMLDTARDELYPSGSCVDHPTADGGV